MTKTDPSSDTTTAIIKEDGMSAAKKPIDPFDTTALRAAPPATEVTEHLVLSVSARKPSRSEFFRVHPEPEYVVDATVLNYESENGREVYFVPPALRAAVPPEEVQAVRIFTAINRNGVVFLWPARLPAEGGAGRSWHTSALLIADMAKGAWLKMAGNRAAGAYEAHRAVGDLGEPQWPGDSLQDLLRKAFADFLIDSPDHDVLRKIRGEL